MKQPNIVEYDRIGIIMNQLGFYLVLGQIIFKKLGFVLNFQTKKFDIDEIILSIRDIIKLSTRANIEWMQMAKTITIS